MSSHNRDEFSPEVKRALAERAGHRCSFPRCPAVTIGPSDETERAVSRTGMACHIAAAASGPGARRYVQQMSAKERASIDNGVWMCFTHGKTVDADEKRFSIPMLKKWRELAEFRAQWILDYGIERALPQERLIGIGFASETLSFSTLGNETQAIGEALLDSCVPLVWGEYLSHAVRDVLVEIVRNTFIHGGASTCRIVIDRHAIHITDDGEDFNWLSLPAALNGRGGAAAVRELLAKFGNKLLLGAKRHNDENLTMVALAHSINDLALVNPCSIEVDDYEWDEVRRSRQIPASWVSPATEPCKILYVILPEFMPHSDAILLSEVIQPRAIINKHMVFVTQNTSRGVKKYLLDKFPFARVLEISSS